MDTGVAVVGVGVLISLFGYLEIIRRDLRSEIKEVRQASETAHFTIQSELSNIKTTQAAHTERLKCIEDKIDSIASSEG